MTGVVVILITTTVNAQRSGRGGKTRPGADTTNRQQQVNNTSAPAYNPMAGIPILVDSSGMQATEVKKSLRPDNAFDKSENPLA